MKFTYTHITKDYTEITKYNISKNNKINKEIMCMYEVNEHWKQYKKEKELQAKIAKEFKLNEWKKEMDKFLGELRNKNGQTNY